MIGQHFQGSEDASMIPVGPTIGGTGLEQLLGIGGAQEFWAFLQANIYWLGFFIGLFLIVSALQQDPAWCVCADQDRPSPWLELA